jgi:hypothetical protein
MTKSCMCEQYVWLHSDCVAIFCLNIWMRSDYKWMVLLYSIWAYLVSFGPALFYLFIYLFRYTNSSIDKAETIFINYLIKIFSRGGKTMERLKNANTVLQYILTSNFKKKWPCTRHPENVTSQSSRDEL